MMEYNINMEKYQFSVQYHDYRFVIDRKFCFLGTRRFGIHFSYHIDSPVSSSFLVPSTCGIDEDLIVEFGITSVYIGNVSDHPQLVPCHYGKMWTFSNFFHGIRNHRGHPIFGVTLSRDDLYIGYYQDHQRDGIGFQIRLNSLGESSRKIQYGYFENNLLCHGRFVSYSKNSISWCHKYNFHRHGQCCSVNLQKFSDYTYIHGERNGHFEIRNTHHSINGNFVNDRIDGLVLFENHHWRKKLYFVKGKCIHGKILFPTNMKFRLDIEDGSEVITDVHYKSAHFPNAIENLSKFPQEFKCPITLQCMSQPACSDSFRFFYDRKSLKAWFQRRKSEPMTNQKLKNRNIYTNFELQNKIYEFLQNYFLSLVD